VGNLCLPAAGLAGGAGKGARMSEDPLHTNKNKHEMECGDISGRFMENAAFFKSKFFHES